MSFLAAAFWHPIATCCHLTTTTMRCRYETTNHLWLILEYCVGGDLMSLLRQVGRDAGHAQTAQGAALP